MSKQFEMVSGLFMERVNDALVQIKRQLFHLKHNHSTSVSSLSAFNGKCH